MHLLDDMRLVIFWPCPPSAHPSTRAQSQKEMNWVILDNSSIIIHGSMIGSHRWQKTGKIAVLFGETRFEVEVKSPTPSQ